MRFAATDQARSYAFEVKLLRADAQTTAISFDAANFFVRLAIARMEMVFDTGSKRIVRYVGRVPPRLAGLRVFDARVEYDFVASDYR